MQAKPTPEASVGLGLKNEEKKQRSNEKPQQSQFLSTQTKAVQNKEVERKSSNSRQPASAAQQYTQKNKNEKPSQLKLPEDKASKKKEQKAQRARSR